MSSEVINFFPVAGGIKLVFNSSFLKELFKKENEKLIYKNFDLFLKAIKKISKNNGLVYVVDKKKSVVFLDEDKNIFLEKFLEKNQVEHCKNLIFGIKKHNAVLDLSQTGAGKTYTAIATAKFLGRKIVAITTLTNKAKWFEVAKLANVKIFVTTYESLKSKNSVIFKKEKKYFWQIKKENFLIVFDEAHKLINKKTINQKILLSAVVQKIPVLILSATLFDNPFEFRGLGFALGIYNEENEYLSWLKTQKADISEQESKKWLINKKEKLKIIARIKKELLEEKRASEILINYSVNNIIKPVLIKDSRVPKIVKAEISLLRLKENKNLFSKFLISRQISELEKIPYIYKKILDLISTEKSIIVFFNFLKSIEILSKMLHTNSFIIGKMNKLERKKVMQNFQIGKEKILLASDAAIEGIDLDDQVGDFPRVTFISPRWSGKKLKQILGRTVRTSTKSDVIQYIVFRDVEKQVYKKMQERADVLDVLSDSDFLEVFEKNKEKKNESVGVKEENCV